MHTYIFSVQLVLGQVTPTFAVAKISSLMCPPPNSFFSVALVAAYSILSRTFWKEWGKLPVFCSCTSPAAGAALCAGILVSFLPVCFYFDSQCSNKKRKIRHFNQSIYFNLLMGHRIHWLCLQRLDMPQPVTFCVRRNFNLTLAEELNLRPVFQKLHGLGSGQISLPSTSERFFKFQQQKKTQI